MPELISTRQLSRIVLKGFKSIAECDIELAQLNILIGCNGAGKSNFIGFFRMIEQMLENKLQVFVSRQGGPDAILHFAAVHQWLAPERKASRKSCSLIPAGWTLQSS